MIDWKVFTAEAIFALSHLVWLFLAWAVWSYHRKRSAAVLGFRLALAFSFIWIRFVEPAQITRHETSIAVGAPARIVLISDLHLGAYKGAGFIKRLAKRVNSEDADCLLIAGDFLYAPRLPLDALFAPLKEINKPVYAVFGNHDRSELGRRMNEWRQLETVKEALMRAGVRVIENQIVDCGGVSVAGVGDRWSGRDNTRHVRDYRGSNPLLMLTHNPDAALGLSARRLALVVAGHTHGGQMRIPWLFHKFMPVAGPFDRGMHAPVAKGGPRIFVTSGVGETALPMRFLARPVIDILVVH